ncbi:MAG: RsmB/NOP family class I SAM-dependent RNA methyltransferase, partial [Elstera sp.]
RQVGKFDRVLVDAPCSGTGTWRRNPDMKWRIGPADVAELTVKQRDILDAAAKLVKPGGRLIYATCSLLPEENEGSVAAFLETHPEFTVKPVTEIWAERVTTPCPAPGPYLRVTPHRHGTDGFFTAVLERRAAVAAPEET